ncbi:MAG TPA: hypothetical protein PK625_11565 [Spirochaetales bacterium]|nr:hypothetical protein [Spirochaetales bacterium]
METNVSNHIPYAYLFGASLSLGRVSVPVPASALPYAHFRNVSGRASPTATVYGLDKLKILDTLIARMRAAKSDSGAYEGLATRSSSERELDALIQHLGREIHTALQAPAEGASAYSRPSVTPGMLLSVAA